MGEVKMMRQRNFSRSFDAYKMKLTSDLGREPTTQEVMIEMQNHGWSFSDDLGPLPADEFHS